MDIAVLAAVFEAVNEGYEEEALRWCLLFLREMELFVCLFVVVRVVS